MDLLHGKNNIGWWLLRLLLLSLLLLSGCGGGGGGGGSASGSTVGSTSNTPTASNHAPIVSNTPAASVNSNSSYSYTPAATDADGDVLTFSITNRPNWATFNSSTGTLSGTPTNANAGTASGIVITVSDGKTTTSVGPFSIYVSASNQTPVVTNSPTTSVNAGSTYTYTPAATDPNGNALTFSIANAPSWASFSTSTGKLSGTPTAADAGTTSGIVITVSNGVASTSIGPFNITVVGISIPIGTATLSWVAPTTRQDGSPLSLSELRGYNVYEGQSATSLTHVINITNPTATNYTITNLALGTHYFTVTTIDTAGNESNFSTLASKTIK